MCSPARRTRPLERGGPKGERLLTAGCDLHHDHDLAAECASSALARLGHIIFHLLDADDMGVARDPLHRGYLTLQVQQRLGARPHGLVIDELQRHDLPRAGISPLVHLALHRHTHYHRPRCSQTRKNERVHRSAAPTLVKTPEGSQAPAGAGTHLQPRTQPLQQGEAVHDSLSHSCGTPGVGREAGEKKGPRINVDASARSPYIQVE
jgi:hypothetical protein